MSIKYKAMVLSCIDPRFQPIIFNYLTKKTELDYFGDVQGLEVKSLNDIDISGFEVKSKPMLYLNWLKSKNPLRGEKE